MWQSCLTCLVVLSSWVTLSSAYIMNLEVEDFQGVYQGRVPRSNASNGMVAHLMYDFIVRYEMCVHSPFELSISDIIYSNNADNTGDEVSVYLDEKLIGSFMTNEPAMMARDSLWNDFESSGPIGGAYFLNYGRHMLTLRVTKSDSFGVELDVVNLEVGNATISNPKLVCDLHCFGDIKYGSTRIPEGAKFFDLKKYSRSTVCAEEENVRVGFYHDSATYFQIKATRPKYETCSNFRDPDFRDCKLASPAWLFTDIPLVVPDGGSDVRQTYRASLTIDSSPTLKRVVMSFDMAGFSVTRGQGERQTAGNLYVRLDDLPPGAEVTMKMSSIGKTGRLDQGDSHTFTSDIPPAHVWQFSDDYWGENDANVINLEVTTNRYNFEDLIIREIKLDKKQMETKQFKISDDGTFIFEGLYREPWWLKQTAMKVEVIDDNRNETDFHDIANLRLYMKKPYEDGYAQIFVIHDDGHTRLQPVAPHGMDWTPFGSSLIIGPNNAGEVRPYASIKSITIRPSKLRLTIRYHDGSLVVLRIVATPKATLVRIVNYSTPMDKTKNALITFLSTWIQDGYSFVDHMAVDGVEEKIMDLSSIEKTKKGRRVHFYRKCLSRLNTQSPDIEISAPRLTREDE